MPCVRPFHAPCTPPTPPSSEPSGRPTRTLMFCSADSPKRMSTWQNDLLLPDAGTIVAVTDLIPGDPTSPPASPASCEHISGSGGGEDGRSRAAAGVAA